MSLAPRLDLRQSQSLVMTPQLQQAIKLLALSNLEIESFIAEELEKNPLLAAAAGEGEAITPVERAEPAPVSSADETATADRLMLAGDAAADAPLDVDYGAETFHHDSAADAMGSLGSSMDGGLRLDGISGAMPDDGGDFDSLSAGDPSLIDHLLAQAGERLDGQDHLIASHIIDAIDEAGYLEESVSAIAARLGVDEAQVESVLGVVQSFDPTGVGARTLAECIALQAKEADRYDPSMSRLAISAAMHGS